MEIKEIDEILEVHYSFFFHRKALISPRKNYTDLFFIFNISLLQIFLKKKIQIHSGSYTYIPISNISVFRIKYL